MSFCIVFPCTGVCAACNKPILTKVVNALGCQWHKEHFTCAQCDVELGSSTYYESNGRPYCEKDYHELFAPRCAYCNGPILEVGLYYCLQWNPSNLDTNGTEYDRGVQGLHSAINFPVVIMVSRHMYTTPSLVHIIAKYGMQCNITY